MRIEHPIPPLYGPDSEILILGSFPSVRSREAQFFYGHPQNRFWRILAALCGEDVPQSIEEKKRLVLDHGFALWDVIASCEIVGSSDSSITDVVPNDLRPILAGSRVHRIFCNGTTSFRLYTRYIQPVTGVAATCLPSSSPANAAWSLDRLTAAWREAMGL
jgi:hypoxanthine-DNA glycosylase